MRVGIIALQHESNTFIAGRTTLSDFAADVLVEGGDVRSFFASAHHEVGGFFQCLDESGIDAVPLLAARATPGGVISRETTAALLARVGQAISGAGAVDGLLVAPHGAAVAEDDADFDGHWLSFVRRLVGPRVPMICTLDLHANVSKRMIEACDATIAYRTNPHLDQRQRGIEAAGLMARTLRGQVRPVQALAAPALAINIERQLTCEQPCSELYAPADAQLRQPAVLSNSVVLGFPYADVPEMGSSFIAVTDGDRALARSLADELADHAVRHRTEFAGKLISVNAALDAILPGDMPVCLLDTGDNVGGGAPGNGTALLHALGERAGWRCFATIFDPESIDRARLVGAGKSVRLSVGGRTGEPFIAEFTIARICGGRWTESAVRHGGASGGDMGDCAVVVAKGMTILLTSRRVPPFSLGPLRTCGIDPAAFDVLVAKGVHAPVAAYGEVCKRFIRVNTPGVTDADLTRLPFRHRRRPMFPFENPPPGDL